MAGKKIGRPIEVQGSGELRYITIAIRESEKEVLEEWAWRMRTNRATLCRKLLMEGLKRLSEDKELLKKFPRHVPPRLEGNELEIDEEGVVATTS